MLLKLPSYRQRRSRARHLLQFDEQTYDYYFGVDNTDHFLKMGLGSVVGTNTYLTMNIPATLASERPRRLHYSPSAPALLHRSKLTPMEYSKIKWRCDFLPQRQCRRTPEKQRFGTLAWDTASYATSASISGTTNYLSKFTSSSAIASLLYMIPAHMSGIDAPIRPIIWTSSALSPKHHRSGLWFQRADPNRCRYSFRH